MDVVSIPTKLAADSYCAYLTGLSVSCLGMEQAINIFGSNDMVDAEMGAYRSLTFMHQGLTGMVDAAFLDPALKGVSKQTTKQLGPEIDTRVAAVAIDAVDYAWENYGHRIVKIGSWALEQQITRPCPAKDPQHVEKIRQNRMDRMTLFMLAQGRVHTDFQEFALKSLTEFRKKAA